MKRTSKKGYTFYACEYCKPPKEDGSLPDGACSFMVWDVPVKEVCPECGQTLFKKAGRGHRKPFCINEKCPNFVPEEKRGFKKKAPAGDGGEKPPEEKPEGKEKSAGKLAGKPAASKAAKEKKSSTRKSSKKKESAE